MKTCAKCGVSKPLSDFHLDASRKDGHRWTCKNCANLKEHPSEWWQQTAEEKRAVSRPRYYQENKAMIGERLQRWRQENPGLTLAYGRAWHAAHPEVQREKSLMRNFGITLKDYNTILDSQGGVCLICLKPERTIDPRTGKVKVLSVDHDHLTNVIRGLLCQRCNIAIGCFEDDIGRMERAVEYLGQAVRQRKVIQLELFGN